MATKKTAKTSARANAIAKELALLAKVGKTALWKRYEEVFGKKTKSSKVEHLRAAIAKKLVESKAQAAKAPERAADTASATQKRTAKRDPRVPAIGTVLERPYHDTIHKVRVLEDGFEYRGSRYRSLSGIAKQITGHEYNGFLFFGLLEKAQAKKGAATAGAASP